MISLLVLGLLGTLSRVGSEVPMLPSRDALEKALLSIIDASLFTSQIELARSAFNTQLETLKTTHPDQYKEYSKRGVDEMAMRAVVDQVEAAKNEPRTGNSFIDMLSNHGIPLASSIYGLENMAKAQQMLSRNNQEEQITKAVVQELQTKMLPNIVSSLIAGKNPFRMNGIEGSEKSLDWWSMVKSRQLEDTYKPTHRRKHSHRNEYLPPHEHYSRRSHPRGYKRRKYSLKSVNYEGTAPLSALRYQRYANTSS